MTAWWRRQSAPVKVLVVLAAIFATFMIARTLNKAREAEAYRDRQHGGHGM